MDLELNNKNVIITGGSGGIGRGLVLEFAKEGANVISASRDTKQGALLEQEAAKQKLAGKVLAVATDVTDRASVDAMIARCHEVFGAVDILVNNAGGVSQPSALEALSDEDRDWEKKLNIDGVVNCCQAVANDMLSRGSGSIINISSNSSLLGEAAAGVAHYGGVKGFVNSFSKSLAWEWAKCLKLCMDGKATPAEGSFTIMLVQLAASIPHVLENILYCALDKASVPKVCNTVATP